MRRRKEVNRHYILFAGSLLTVLLPHKCTALSSPDVLSSTANPSSNFLPYGPSLQHRLGASPARGASVHQQVRENCAKEPPGAQSEVQALPWGPALTQSQGTPITQSQGTALTLAIAQKSKQSEKTKGHSGVQKKIS